MSVEAVYSPRDEERVRKARKRGLRPSHLRPVPRPIGWRVRWREKPELNPSSHTLLVDDGYSRDDADALDQKIRRIKRENSGIATRWMIFGGQDPDSEMPTVEEFATTRFASYVAKHLKPRTQKDYTFYLDHAIRFDVETETVEIDGKKHKRRTYRPSELSQMRLDQVRSHHIEAWLEHIADQGLGPRAIELALDTLQSLFLRAKELGHVEANPTHGLRRTLRSRGRSRTQPVKPSRVVDPLRIERLRRCLELVGGMRDWMIMALMSYVGLRPSELVVLYWHQLIDEHGQARPFIEIDRGLSDRVEVDTPKQGKFRLVRVFRPVREDIERYYEWCGRPPRDQRAFLSATGELLNAERLGDVLRPAMRRAEVEPFRPYDQRHTCASLLFGGGDESNPGKPWSIAEVALQLGHSIEVCSRVYLHVIENPLYRGMPIEQVIEYARDVAAKEQPGTPKQDKRRLGFRPSDTAN